MSVNPISGKKKKNKPKKPKFQCVICDIECPDQKRLDLHFASEKHERNEINSKIEDMVIEILMTAAAKATADTNYLVEEKSFKGRMNIFYNLLKHCPFCYLQH